MLRANGDRFARVGDERLFPVGTLERRLAGKASYQGPPKDTFDLFCRLHQKEYPKKSKAKAAFQALDADAVADLTDRTWELQNAWYNADPVTRQPPTHRRKALRDPDKPTRPRTAFVLFQLDQRQALLQTDPNLQQVEIFKLVAERWNDPKFAKVRKKHEKRYTKLKASYDAAMANYKAPEKIRYKYTKRKAKKDPNEPKRPASAYVIYATEQMALAHAANPKGKQIMKQVAAAWKGLSAAKKKIYEKRLEEEQARYAKEKAAWDAKAGERMAVLEAARAEMLAAQKAKKDAEQAKKDAAQAKKDAAAAERAQKKEKAAAAKAAKRAAKMAAKAAAKVAKHAAKMAAKAAKDAAKAEVRKRKKMAKKDPNMPRRPKTAYLWFGSSVRPELQAAHPDWKSTDIMREIASRWNALPAGQKAKFEAMAAKDKATYATAMQRYVPPPVDEDEDAAPPVQKKKKHAEQAASRKRKKMAKKDPNMPRRPKTAYLWFGSSVRPELQAAHPDWKSTDIMREIASRWNALPAGQKAKFEAMAAKDKATYATAMQRYVPPPVDEDEDAAPPVQKKKKHAKQAAPKKTTKAKKKVKQKTAFDFYVIAKYSKYRTKNPTATEAEMRNILLGKFSTMPAERMKKYTGLAAAQR